MTKLREITLSVIGKDPWSYQQVPKHILFTKLHTCFSKAEGSELSKKNR